MTARPLVSVVIPCFNARATIAAAIESSVSQSPIATEVLVVDDGSTDDSLAVIRKFESDVRVFTGPNQGVSRARNRGIAAARGEWIVFLDSDDILEPGTLRTRIEDGSLAGADVVICDWQERREDAFRQGPATVKSVHLDIFHDEPDVACALNCWLPTAAIMYRASLVADIGGFREDLPVIQDARFFFDAAFRRAKIARSPHVGATYLVRPESLSRRNPARFWKDVLVNGKQIELLWSDRGGKPSNRQASALAEIYNGAAQGLFAARDASFRDAIEALRSAGLAVSWRNRMAEIASQLGGMTFALEAASAWRRCRRLLQPLRG